MSGIPHKFTCPECRREFQTSACTKLAPEEYPSEETLAVFCSMLYCTPCHTYLTLRHQIEARIRKAAVLLLTARETNHKALEQVEQTVRERLSLRLREFTNVLGDRYRKPPEFDPETVDMIMANPMAWEAVLNQLKRNFSRLSRH